MQRLAAVFLAASFSLMALPASAKSRLDNPADIQQALAAGNDVAVAIDLSLCTPNSANATPGRTRGGLRIGAYRIVEDGTLSFSDAHFTVARDGLPIQQLLRYQVRPDGTIDFTMFVFDLPGYQQRSEPLAYRCAMNQGLRFHAD